MDRRDALKAMAVAGVGVSVVTEKQAENAFMLVLKHPGRMSMKAHSFIKQNLAEGLKGTPLDGVKIMILEEGMDLELVTRDDERHEVASEPSKVKFREFL